MSSLLVMKILFYVCLLISSKEMMHVNVLMNVSLISSLVKAELVMRKDPLPKKANLTVEKEKL